MQSICTRAKQNAPLPKREQRFCRCPNLCDRRTRCADYSLRIEDNSEMSLSVQMSRIPLKKSVNQPGLLIGER